VSVKAVDGVEAGDELLRRRQVTTGFQRGQLTASHDRSLHRPSELIDFLGHRVAREPAQLAYGPEAFGSLEQVDGRRCIRVGVIVLWGTFASRLEFMDESTVIAGSWQHPPLLRRWFWHR
jgi:hypothetical protein